MFFMLLVGTLFEKDLIGGKPSTLRFHPTKCCGHRMCHQATMFDGHRTCGSGIITFLICHEKALIKVSHDFEGGTILSRYHPTKFGDHRTLKNR